MEMKHNSTFFIMWCHFHWYQHHMTPMASSMAHDIEARTGNSTGTKSYNNSKQSSQHDKWCHWKPHHHHVTGNMLLLCSCEKLICPSNATYKNYSHAHLDIYVSIYTSYQLTPMNNETRSTGIHASHITGIHSWKNMPVKLHKHDPLHFYIVHI